LTTEFLAELISGFGQLWETVENHVRSVLQQVQVGFVFEFKPTEIFFQSTEISIETKLENVETNLLNNDAMISQFLVKKIIIFYFILNLTKNLQVAVNNSIVGDFQKVGAIMEKHEQKSQECCQNTLNNIKVFNISEIFRHFLNLKKASIFIFEAPQFLEEKLNVIFHLELV